MITPRAILYYSLCYLLVGGFSYQGGINPHNLGLLDTCSVLLVIIGVIGLLSKFNSKVIVFSHVIALCVFIIITVCSWFYFDYYQSLFTLDILSIGDDLGAGLKAISFEPYGWTIIFLVLTCCVLTVLGIYSDLKITKRMHKISILFIVIGVIGLLVVEHSISVYKLRGIPWLHPANLHPIHALFKTDGSTDKADTAEHKASFEYFRKLNADTAYKESSNITHVKISNQNYNIIVVLLESFRADLTGYYSYGEKNNTPNFDAIAKEHIVARRYYSNTNFTISAEYSIWCGAFDTTSEKKLAYTNKELNNHNCLPTTLKNEGYESFYFHGNTGSFYNRSKFLPKLGFDNLYFHKDQSAPKINEKKIGWGIDDLSMFNIMLDTLENRESKAPFFSHITLLSNHYPFHWDLQLDQSLLPYPFAHAENSVLENYQNSIFYSDYALGEFWKKFKASDLYHNTIVIITNDHGIWQFDESNSLDLLDKNERFYRSPLVIYDPASKPSHEIQSLASHIDLAPTLLGMLDIEHDHYIGKNLLFSNEVKVPWAIMNKGEDIILHHGEDTCFFNLDQCSMLQQECSGWKGDIYLTKQLESPIKCIKLSGDLLGKASRKQSENDESLLKRARMALEYQNNKNTK